MMVQYLTLPSLISGADRTVKSSRGSGVIHRGQLEYLGDELRQIYCNEHGIDWNLLGGLQEVASQHNKADAHDQQRPDHEARREDRSPAADLLLPEGRV